MSSAIDPAISAVKAAPRHAWLATHWSAISALLGPVAFIAHDRPISFALAIFLESMGLALIFGAIPNASDLGLALIIVTRIAAARLGHGGHTGRSAETAAFLIMSLVYVMVMTRSLSVSPGSFWFSFPKNLGVAPATARIIDSTLDWTALTFAPAFGSITWLARIMLQAITDGLAWIPWPIYLVSGIAIGWWAGGLRLAAFVAAGILYIAVFGFWDKAIATMGLVGSAVFLSAVFGLPLGILLGKSARASGLISPLLDAMQTLPSFVYLIPAVAFFSVGKPPAVLATMIVALPLMVRLTALGISQVAGDVKEAAALDGASTWRSLLLIELPLASNAILLGFNQTVMASLSMVVVAALIGAGGLGFDVLQALNNVQSGNGVLAGLAIVICAVVPDRILQAAIRRFGVGQTR